MTETIAYIRNSLKDIYPPGEAQALVRLIMERVCGLSTHQLLLGKGKELSDTEKFKIKEIVEGLRLYKPIQYLLGIADFYGIEFKVTPDVLIPRPETAELVERIITDYRGQAPRILDIGTGSGCIAISLAKHLPKAEVAAVDISPEALAVAEENDPDVERYADVVFWRPACPTLMSPLVDVVPLQLFAMDMAKLKNYDVDKPRNLAKSVTVE